MKPTSLLFLVLALVLFFGGLMTCSVAESMAKAQGIKIFEQVKDKNGDFVYTFKLTDEKLSKLNLTFSNADVNIFGSSPESYIELVNFDPYDYSASPTGSSVTIDGTVGGLSSLIDLSGGGLRFKGLRYFFADKPSHSAKRSVNIYITDACDIKSLTLNLEKGNVNIKNIYNSIDYNLNVKSGNINLDSVVTESVINLDISAGNVDIKNSECVSVNASLTAAKMNLDINRLAPEFLYYDVKATNSKVTYNGVLDDDGQLKITISPDLQKCMIKIDALDSEISLKDTTTVQTPEQ